MTPTAPLLGVQYPCRCGNSHPRLVRLFSMEVLVCPEETDDALHFADTVGIRMHTGELQQVPIKPAYLVTGAGKSQNLVTAITTMNARLHELEERVRECGALCEDLRAHQDREAKKK